MGGKGEKEKGRRGDVKVQVIMVLIMEAQASGLPSL